MLRSLRGVLVGLVVLAGIVGSASEAVADPLKIRVGWSTMPGHMIPVLFANNKGLRHYGKSYTVEPVLFRGSAPQLTALAAGEIDMIASSPATMALAVLNAGLDVRVVADIIQDGVPGHHSETWLVLAESGITSAAQLKGKRIATNAIGSASDTAMRAIMLKAGLKDRRDYITIQAAFPSMLALLDEKKVDAAPILMPDLIEAQKNPKYRAVFQAKDGLGRSDLVFLLGQAGFIEKNRAAVQDFVEDYVRANRWFADPANRKEALQIIGDYMKIKPEQLEHLYTEKDYFRDPYGMPDYAALQSAIDVSRDAGILPDTISVKKYSDPGLVDEARRRIIASP